MPLLRQLTPHSRALLDVHTAVMFFGLAGLFAKLVRLPPALIVFGRVFFATAFLSVVLAFAKQGLKLGRRRDYLLLTLLGLILAVHWGTFFQAIQLSTVAIGLLTFSTFPVFVTFLEPIFFKERMAPQDFAVAMASVCGVAMVVPGFEISDSMTRGALWGIASGFTFALLCILNRKYVRAYSSIVVAFYQDAAAAVLLVPFLVLSDRVIRPLDILLLAVLGIVFTGFAHALFIKALTQIKAQTASIIASLEPVYGIIAACLLFGEIPSARVIAGGVIILGSAFYATTRR